MSKVKIIGVIAVILLAIGAVVLTSRQNTTNTNNSNSTVVAVVNGKELPRSEYDMRYAALTAQYQGQEFDEAELQDRIVTQMISEELLLQDAQKKGITVSPEEVDAQFQQIDDQFETDEELDQALAAENLTRDQLRTNIYTQMTIDKYVQTATEGKDVEPTAEEVQSAYDASVEGMENGPTLEEVRSQVEEQVRQQKITDIMMQVIQDLRNQSNIEILI